MEKSEIRSTIGAVLGCTLGSLVWLIGIGIIIGSPVVVVLTIVSGTICVIGTLKTIRLYPDRKYLITGSAILWLAITNFSIGNVIYGRIPNTALGFSTGIQSLSLVSFNGLLFLISLFGFYFCLRDLRESQKGGV
jgi:hypothetical protein